jgi:hypothetical protein
MSDFAKGGLVAGPNNAVTVRVRTVEGGRREYWEPELNRWVAILSAAEVSELSKEALATLKESQ